MGYSFAAKEHSQATHCIPATGFQLAKSDNPRITDDIKTILRQNVFKFHFTTLENVSMFFPHLWFHTKY